MSVVAHKMHTVSFFILFKQCVAMGNQYFLYNVLPKSEKSHYTQLVLRKQKTSQSQLTYVKA